MSDQDDHLRHLEAELDELRRSLVKLRAQITLPAAQRRPAEAIQSMHQNINALKTYARLLQSDIANLRLRTDQAEREASDQRARRADATAKLKARDRALEQIQQSASWKIIKPVWKLFNSQRRNSKASPTGPDLAFALDLPTRWNTNRDVILIKGWCFSRNGRQLAGVRAKVGKKGKLARYGLERPDVAASFRDYPEARRCGFTVEIDVLPGTSTIRLEAIEHGQEWQLFLEKQLTREPNGDPLLEDLVSAPESPDERILKLPPLSASKAFELIKPGFQRHSTKITGEAPFFSILTPIHNTKPEWLADASLTIINQTFADWEWCLVDDGSHDRETKKLLDLLKTVSPRVRVSVSAGKGISAATNHALDDARGEYVCFLDHDDLLHPHALELMREKLAEGYDVAYSDEDKLDDASGALVEPFFKPDWSPEYFRGAMYVGHLLCVKRELAQETRFDSNYDGVQDFELILRLSETAPRIGHVPQILYHWRKTPGSIAEKSDAKPYIEALQEKAVNAHLARLALPAEARASMLPHRLEILPRARAKFPRISVLIPSKDAPEILDRCLESISRQTSYPEVEIVVIDNESTDEKARQVMQEYDVRVMPFPGRFNFSRANNCGARHATGDFLVFLNNDTEIISGDWLQHLLYYAEQPDVGAAGALLVYEDRTVQHAGVALGMRGTADHLMRGFPLGADGYAGSLACAREVSAVTAACMMMRKSLFEETGGFNEHFFTAYQDLDLCLRLRKRGLRIIYTPRAVVVHHEWTSRKTYYDMVDRTLLLDRWEEIIERGDPYYNRNLDLERGDYSPGSP